MARSRPRDILPVDLFIVKLKFEIWSPDCCCFPNIQMAVLWGTFRWSPLVCHTHGKCNWIFSLHRRARASSDLLVSSTQIELDLKQMTKLKIFYKTQIARHWILRFSYVRHLEQTKVWTNVFTNKLQKVIEVSYRITETSCKLQKKTSNQQMSNGIFSFGFSSSIRFDRQQMTKF